MSKFFEALEQAARERAEREKVGPATAPPPVRRAVLPDPPPAASPAPRVETVRPPAARVETDVPVRVFQPVRRAPATASADDLLPLVDAPVETDGNAARLSPLHPAMDSPVEDVQIEIPEQIDEHLVSLIQPHSVEAEQYRTLRHFVEQGRRTADLKVIGVTSAAPGDGKTLTAINLAGALAQAPGTHVLLIDMDLRKPAVARHLALSAREDDLTQALLNPALTLSQIVQPCPPFNLGVVPTRRSVKATYELLKSPHCAELITAAREAYDYVVVDLPPLIPIPDCRIVEKSLDGILVVVAAHKTPRKMLSDAVAALDPAKVVGLVFNGDDSPLRAYSYRVKDERKGWWQRIFARGRQRVGRAFSTENGRSSPDA